MDNNSWLVSLSFSLLILDMVVQANHHHYPDLSCYQSFDRKGMDVHATTCNKKMKNPLNRPCYKACILERLLILTPPDILATTTNTTTTDYKIIRAEDDYMDESLVEIRGILYNEFEAVDAIKKISQSCTETMQQIVNVEKKNCEAWDPIYTCVQQSLCSTEKLYPDISCHDDYKSFPLLKEWGICNRRAMLPTTKECLKGCMLSSLGIYLFDPDQENPVPALGTIDGAYYSYNMQNFIDSLSGNNKLAEEIVGNINRECNATFEDTVNQKHRPCEEWTDFYSCVEKAVGCTGDTFISSTTTVPPPMSTTTTK